MISEQILEHFKLFEVINFKANEHSKVYDQVARPMRITTKTGITIPHGGPNIKEKWHKKLREQEMARHQRMPEPESKQVKLEDLLEKEEIEALESKKPIKDWAPKKISSK